MNDQENDFQADGNILDATVSDEALEACRQHGQAGNHLA